MGTLDLPFVLVLAAFLFVGLQFQVTSLVADLFLNFVRCFCPRGGRNGIGLAIRRMPDLLLKAGALG